MAVLQPEQSQPYTPQPPVSVLGHNSKAFIQAEQPSLLTNLSLLCWWVGLSATIVHERAMAGPKKCRRCNLRAPCRLYSCK